MEKENTINHVPPNNIEAERSVLGSMLLSEDAFQKAIDVLKPLDFYRPAHKDIFASMVRIYTERKPLDLIILSETLQKENKLESVGGIEYITELVEIVPTAINIDIYIKIVEEKSLLRQLINAATKISSMAFNEDESAQDIIEQSERLIFNISNSGSKSDFKDIKSLLMDTYEWISERTRNKDKAPGLITNFKDLDMLTGGLQKGELVILAARPSMGKTALAMNIALNSALNSKATVAVFSLEMGAESLTQRMVASHGRSDMQTFKKGKFQQNELEKIIKAASEIHNTNIFIDDSTIITPINMLTKCRKLKAEKGKLDLIVIDYLQMVKAPKDVKDNRVLEVSMISLGLKSLAREMDCPVICLSQLTRDVEKRPDHRPMLSDLRESGSIEADADIVMMLYRPKYYEKKELVDTGEVVEGEVTDAEDEIAELIIAKHRNGPTGTINLKFVSQYVSFYGIDNEH